MPFLNCSYLTLQSYRYIVILYILFSSVEYNGIIYNVGDFVLIANEDVPDESQTSPQFCDVARISNLYEKGMLIVELSLHAACKGNY